MARAGITSYAYLLYAGCLLGLTNPTHMTTTTQQQIGGLGIAAGSSDSPDNQGR